MFSSSTSGKASGVSKAVGLNLKVRAVTQTQVFYPLLCEDSETKCWHKTAAATQGQQIAVTFVSALNVSDSILRTQFKLKLYN